MRNRTILVSMLQEPGHLNPTFKLTRALRSRGYEVRYFAIPDLEARVRAQGFEVVPWFPELFPAGFLEQEDALGLLAQRRRITERYERMAQALLRGEGPWAEIQRLKPLILLSDVAEPVLGLIARRRGQSMALLNTSLPQTKDPGLPPLRSAGAYDPSALGRIRSELRWLRFQLGRRVGALLADAFSMCPPYELTRRVGVELGLDGAELDCDTVYQPQLRGPLELVLCPEPFDFPRPSRPQRRYVESIDLERSEPDFDWSRLDADKPLVYCALGEQRYRPGLVPALFERIVEVFARRPEWQLLLSYGRHRPPARSAARLPNVVMVPRAPQLAVLRRARVMITHGGLGSIKECIAHGVPMLVFPLAMDQPGNAARIEYHGVGLSGHVRRTSSAQLAAMLELLIGDPRIQEQAAQLRARCERFEQGQRGADLIEGLVELSRTPAVHAG